MNVSYIIPAFNEADGILDTLSSIRKYHPSDVVENYEIIVVDNGSTDDTAKIVQNFGAKLFIRTEGTIASLRNFGVTHSSGDVIVFLDADVLLTESWQQNVSDVFREVVFGNLITGSTTFPPDGQNIFHKYWFKAKAKKGSKNYIGSAHLIMGRCLFEKLDGFNENLETSEDYDLCQRALKSGANLKNNSELLVYHTGYPNDILSFIKREIWHGKSDCKSINTMISSKSFIAAIIFIFTLLTSVTFSIFGYLNIALILFLISVSIVLTSSYVWYKDFGLKVVLINSWVFVLYYIGRASSLFLNLYKFTKK